MNAPIKLPPDPSEIISRSEAKARGLKRFFTGEPCSEGHVSEGWTTGMCCIECFYIKLRERYYRDHENNKKRVRAASKREQMLNPAAKRARHQKWYWKNIELNRKRSREKAADIRAKNPEEANLKARQKYRKNPDGAYRSYKKWADSNPEKVRELARRWRLNGHSNPKGEISWLRKNQAQLRNVKRYLRDLRRGQSESSQPEM